MLNILGPVLGYINMLDASLEAKARKEAESPLDRMPLRPSAAGYCARRLANEFYDYRKGIRRAAEVKDAKTMRLLSFGNSVEWHVINQFKQMSLEEVRKALPELSDLEAFQVKYQQQVLDFFQLQSGERIEGSLDMVFVSNRTKGILDVKSKKDKFWQKWKTDWDKTTEKLKGMRSVHTVNDSFFWVDNLEAFLEELDDPFFSDNFTQLNFYACTDFIRQRGIDHASILQYGKNDSRMREVRFRPSQAVYDYVKQKFEAVQHVVDVLEDPDQIPCEYEAGSIRCRFCPWNCHGENTKKD